MRSRGVTALRIVVEALVLALVCLSPWAFGSVDAPYEFFLRAGIAALLLLWAIRAVLAGRFAWKTDGVILCLGALGLFGIGQLISLPRPVLAWLSPGTVYLYDQFLPAVPERLPMGEDRPQPRMAAGSSISLYPAATHTELIRLLAVLVAYVVARNNCSSAGALRRLNIALVVNGSLLSLFAIVQFSSSPPATLYWSIKTPGAAVFGPFVCRTHFPAYVNVCIGAALGLLLSLRDENPGEAQSHREFDSGRATNLLDNPRQLWLSGALALMIAAVALSLSRGGFLALLGGAAVVLMLRPVRMPRFQRSGPALVGVVLALGLVIWLGFERVENRLSTIGTGQALQESRLPLWADAWPLVSEFPLWGTGYGTFRWVEPLHRERVSARIYHEHAHNEFLEAIIEGGVIRLAITVLAIGLVFWAGLKAVRRYHGRPEAGLALGAVFGFTTLVIHSIGDFGIHLPAIAFLAAVLCAQLVTLGWDKPEQPATAPEAVPTSDLRSYVLRLWGIVLGVSAALSLALVLWGEGLRMFKVVSLQVIAQNLEGSSTNAADRERRLAYLDLAVRLGPDNAGIHVDAARAHLARYQEELAKLAKERQAAAVAELVFSASPSASGPVVAPIEMVSSLWLGTWESSVAGAAQRQARQHLLPALRYILTARDLCPLDPRPQIQLVDDVTYLAKADPTLAYLDRAKLLVTNEPRLWYGIGAQELRMGQRGRACQSWRKSLELSNEHLSAILDLGKRYSLTPEDFVDRILPDRPEVLIAAAMHLYPPGRDAVSQRRPFLEKALVRIKEQPSWRSGESYFNEAKIAHDLGKTTEAAAAYQLALEMEPRRCKWRLEYARLLAKEGKVAEANEQLRRVLSDDPGNSQARALLVTIDTKAAQQPVDKPASGPR